MADMTTSVGNGDHATMQSGEYGPNNRSTEGLFHAGHPSIRTWMLTASVCCRDNGVGTITPEALAAACVQSIGWGYPITQMRCSARPRPLHAFKSQLVEAAMRRTNAPIDSPPLGAHERVRVSPSLLQVWEQFCERYPHTDVLTNWRQETFLWTLLLDSSDGGFKAVLEAAEIDVAALRTALSDAPRTARDTDAERALMASLSDPDTSVLEALGCDGDLGGNTDVSVDPLGDGTHHVVDLEIRAWSEDAVNWTQAQGQRTITPAAFAATMPYHTWFWLGVQNEIVDRLGSIAGFARSIEEASRRILRGSEKKGVTMAADGTTLSPAMREVWRRFLNQDDTTNVETRRFLEEARFWECLLASPDGAFSDALLAANLNPECVHGLIREQRQSVDLGAVKTFFMGT